MTILYDTYSTDFLVDTMQSVDKMLRKKRLNPDEKADLPFPDAVRCPVPLIHIHVHKAVVYNHIYA